MDASFFNQKMDRLAGSLGNLSQGMQIRREKQLGQEILRRSEGGKELGMPEIQELSAMYGLPPEAVFQKVAPVNKFQKAKQFERYGAELQKHMAEGGDLTGPGLMQWSQKVGVKGSHLPEFLGMVQQVSQFLPPSKWTQAKDESGREYQTGPDGKKEYIDKEDKPIKTSVGVWVDKWGGRHVVPDTAWNDELTKQANSEGWKKYTEPAQPSVENPNVQKREEDRVKRGEAKAAISAFNKSFTAGDLTLKGINVTGQALDVTPEQRPVLARAHFERAYKILTEMEKAGVPLKDTGFESSEQFKQTVGKSFKAVDSSFRTKELTTDVAKQFLMKANGDRAKAMQMAKDEGFTE